jgi:LPS-assembly lipoprotein
MNGVNVTRRSWLALAASVVLLSACGFQLRGSQDYPFKRLAIAGTTPEMTARIQRMVEGGSDTKIVTSGKDADATLSISEGRGNGVLSINSAGQVREYELDYSMTYQLVGADGTVLLPPSAIRLNRAMTYSDQFALAKVQESDLLYRDMQQDAVEQLLRRLAAVRELHPTNGGVKAVAPRAPLPTPPL